MADTNPQEVRTPEEVRRDIEQKLKPVIVPRLNRFIIAALGIPLYFFLKEIISFILIMFLGKEVITPGVETMLSWFTVIAWFAGWFGNDVPAGSEGVVDFMKKKIRLFSLANGRNWLPVFFGVEPEDIQWKVKDIPATAAEKGFEVLSEDDVTLMTRVSIPWRISNPFASQMFFDVNAIDSQIRSVAVQALRSIAGSRSSNDLQKKVRAEDIKAALTTNLNKVMEEFPIDINLDQITVSKFEAPEEVKQSQRQKKIEEGQKAGEKTQSEHIQAMVDDRLKYYLDHGYDKNNAADKKEALQLAIHDVHLEIGKSTEEIIRLMGGGTERENAGALMGRQPRNA